MIVTLGLSPLRKPMLRLESEPVSCEAIITSVSSGPLREGNNCDQ